MNSLLRVVRIKVVGTDIIIMGQSSQKSSQALHNKVSYLFKEKGYITYYKI